MASMAGGALAGGPPFSIAVMTWLTLGATVSVVVPYKPCLKKADEDGALIVRQYSVDTAIGQGRVSPHWETISATKKC